MFPYILTVMKTTGKHYKFINSKTGYAIFYYTLCTDSEGEDAKAELEKIKLQVATSHTISADTVYWQAIEDDETAKGL